MKRFNELLAKRKNLTANIYEEEELISLSKNMTEDELKYVDRSLLVYSYHQRLDSILSKMDDLIKLFDKAEKMIKK